MLKKLTLPLGALVLMAAGAIWTALPQAAGLFAPPAFAAETAEVTDFAMGAEDAPLTVIEYASFTCPHCADFHEDVFPKLKADYIDTGKVRFVYREVYFDRPSLWAGMVARCAGEVRYFGVIGMIYDKQREWIGDGSAPAIAANLRKIGKTAGLNDAELDSCLADEALAKAMIANYETNANADGLEGTPSFVIDGKLYSNMSYAKMQKLLDEKLGG